MAHITRSRKKRYATMRAMHQGLDVRVLLLLASRGACFYCGVPLRLAETTVDHKQPICHGGTNGLDNLCAACQDCNKAKGRKTFEEYRARCGGAVFWGEQPQPARRRA